MFKLVIVACLLVAVQLTLSAPSTDAPAAATDNNSTSSGESSAANATDSDEKHIIVTPKPLLLNAPGGINQRNRRYAQVNNERGVFPGAVRATSAPSGSTDTADDATVSTNSTTS